MTLKNIIGVILISFFLVALLVSVEGWKRGIQVTVGLFIVFGVLALGLYLAVN